MMHAERRGQGVERRARHGLVLLKKPMQHSVQKPGVCDVISIREASTGAVVVQLPQVWAVAEAEPAQIAEARETAPPPPVEVAFYRKYTEAMLRRYMRLAMESGRVPSLVGKEMFRGQVTHYRVEGFDDVVIFCHDVSKCLKRLGAVERELVDRIALQQYTQGEAAALTGMSLRHVVRRYAEGLDSLTQMFLETRLMEPQKACQGG